MALRARRYGKQRHARRPSKLFGAETTTTVTKRVYSKLNTTAKSCSGLFKPFLVGNNDPATLSFLCAPQTAREREMPKTEWNSTTAPEEGELVYVLAADNRGQYVIPFPVIF